ncbi:ADP-ribosylation factor-like protein 6-interacting protein 1 isoform X2 [Babylonia areolata]|uniref:ADP-ribosylation factor-like protein 6-interacting protein 1 isoform X2 n=1 Tax=Babylonia areolata TaxID=304850 RepID=UPI003FCF7EDD
MADSDSSHGSLQSEEAASRQQELDDLKKELEGWRGAFGPIMSVLMWERRHHPVIIFAITTLVFVIIWLLEPSVLTTFSLLFLVLICIDFAMPYVSPYLFSGGSTGAGEQQFNDACEKILLLRTHISEFIQGMSILKQEKPKIYFILVMAVLIVFAWIGNLMDNLYLSYCIVLTTLMMPGMLQTRVMQRNAQKLLDKIKHVVFGRLEVIKRKVH